MRMLCFKTGLPTAFLALVWSSVAVSSVAEQIVDLVLPSNQMPFVDVSADNALEGVIGETAYTILREMGYRLTPDTAGINAVHNMVDTGQARVALGVLATENQYKHAYYSEPIIVERNVLIAKTEDSLEITSLADLQGRTLGAISGSSHPILDEYNVNFEYAFDHDINVQKVIAGEIDAAIVPFIAYAFPSQGTDFFANVSVVPFALDSVPLGIALADECFSESEITEFNALLEQFLSTDQFQDILAFHGLANVYYPVKIPAERPTRTAGPR